MGSLTIANVRGIDVRVHPSFLLVFAWAIYHFGVSRHAGVSGVLYGMLLIVLVFGCVVLHELGHSVMAQEHGVRVRNITLFPFGGAAFIEQMPVQPRAELAITLAGPAVNMAIAVTMFPFVLLFGIVRGYDSLGDYFRYFQDYSFSSLMLYLFFANLMIFAFNLIPAFPMDGGRVLRALLTRLTGRDVATTVATTLGMLIAIAIVIAGIALRDLLLPLLAIFILVAAYGEAKAARMESSMRRLRVGQFALWDSGGISPSQPIAAALRGGPRDLVVTSGGQVVGMLWRRDVLNALNGGFNGMVVADLMESDVLSVDIDDSVYDVQQQMHALNRWAVPVTESGVYRGIFTADRFVHVYRQLNALSPDRRVAGFAENTRERVARARPLSYSQLVDHYRPGE